MFLKERIEAGFARLVAAINAVDAKLSAGSPVLFKTVEVDLGSAPTLSGKFNINIIGTPIASGKPVLIYQAVGPYTNKGTLADEAEMDQIDVSGSSTSTTVITCYWASQYRIAGNFKFNYLVGA